MAYTPISRTVPQYFASGVEASGYYLKGYSENTTTPLSMATDDTGGTLKAKCQLGTHGYPISTDGDDTTVFIPHFNADYKLALYTNETDADNNTTANAVWIVDNIPVIAADVPDIPDSLNNWFATVLALQSSTNADITLAKVQGYTTEADGFSYHYSLDTSDTSTADDGLLNIVDSQSPRVGTWKLLKKDSSYSAIGYRLPPSKNKFIQESVSKTGLSQVKVGNGNIYPGSATTDLVYRTARNAQGGTDGTFDVSARFAVEITDLVNTVDFEIEIDSGYTGGVTVRGIATDDSTLSTSSISYFSLTDNGGGNYTYGPWTPTGAKSYYGFEVKLDPTNTTNDDTLHDEYFVIETMTIIQNSVDLLNMTEVLGSSTWAQQVLVSYPRGFATQTLASAATNDVFITHTQCISGSSYRWGYASPSGLSSNDGTEFSEWDLATARNYYNAGALPLLLLEAGTYTLSGQKPRDIFTLDQGYGRVLCQDGEALIDTGSELLFSSMSSVGSHYEIAYSETNHYNATAIGAGTTTPKIVLSTRNETLTEVYTSGEVDATDWSFYWDNANKKFLIRFDGTNTDDVIVCESGNLFYGEGMGYFGAANIYMTGVQGAFLNIATGQYYETYNTGTKIGNAAGNIYDLDDVDGVQVDDYAKKAQNDAYNYHGTGGTELYDCIAEHCKDDGCSHHDNCIGYIQGGRYDSNGKGGVIPAFGASVVCNGVTADDNADGDSPNAANGNYGGFVCLSNDADSTPTMLTTYNCTANGNDINYLSSGGQSIVTVINCTSTTAADKDFGSETWSSNTGHGKLITVNTDGAYTFTHGEKLKIFN